MAEQPAPAPFSLPEAPNDGVTALKYVARDDGKSILASTSWDGTLRLHDTTEKTHVATKTMECGPLLCLASSDSDGVLYTGGMDGSVRSFDPATSESQVVGMHSSSSGDGAATPACSCLVRFQKDNSNLIASASWSKEIKLWDVRSPSSASISSFEIPGKAYGIDLDHNNNRIVVATSGRKNAFFDLNGGKLEKKLERDSTLKFQSRTVRFFPDGNTIAVGSVEGRVGVEPLEDLGLPSAVKKYAFKCHRVNDMVYPVNCIEFHPKFAGTFATGGCDGTVVLWDGFKKKRLSSLPSFPTSISAIAFNKDGSEIAVASSYTFEDGDREHPKDEIFVRKLLDSECKPKPKS